MSAVEWDFNRTAKELVAAQQQQQQQQQQDNNYNSSSASTNDDNGEPATVPSSSSSSMIELNHWVVEHGQMSNRVKNDGSGGDVRDVYLLHPPVLIMSSRTINAPSHPLKGFDERDDIEDVEEIADEFNIELLLEDDDSNANIVNHDLYEQHAATDEAPTAAAATGCNNSNEYYTEWTFSIVFHPTWRVPALYFACGRTDGTPLNRRQVLDILLLLRRDSHEKNTNNNNEGGRNEDESLWEFVSREEHPVSGKPCYFLHPCRTAERMELMMMTMMQNNDSNDEQTAGAGAGAGAGGRCCCPLLSWMTMILPVVGCRISPEVFCRISNAIMLKKEE